jgi:hypothetical protein
MVPGAPRYTEHEIQVGQEVKAANVVIAELWLWRNNLISIPVYMCVTPPGGVT